MERPTEEEIQAKLEEAVACCNRGSKYPGMSYEEGVRVALEWVQGDTEDGDIL